MKCQLGLCWNEATTTLDAMIWDRSVKSYSIPHTINICAECAANPRRKRP